MHGELDKQYSTKNEALLFLYVTCYRRIRIFALAVNVWRHGKNPSKKDKKLQFGSEF